MKVFILEDEPVQQFRIEGLVIDYLKKKNYLNDGVFAFGRTRDLLEELEVSSQNNIYFLDIMIGNNEKAGLEIAEEIRKIDPIGQINFVTTHSEFAPITYEYFVNAHDFIDKLLPQMAFDKKIFRNIDQYVETNRIKTFQQVFYYTSKTGKRIDVLYSNICYIETSGSPHKLILQMDSESLSFYGNMNDIEEVSDKLVRIHRSFLVNKDRLKELCLKERIAVLDDGTKLPISRARARFLKKIEKNDIE